MLPSAQVFVYEPRLSHSIWVDYYSRARTVEGLVRNLRKSVKSGKYLGYRLIHVYVEILGNCDQPSKSDLRQPFIPGE